VTKKGRRTVAKSREGNVDLVLDAGSITKIDRDEGRRGDGLVSVLEAKKRFGEFGALGRGNTVEDNSVDDQQGALQDGMSTMGSEQRELARTSLFITSRI